MAKGVSCGIVSFSRCVKTIVVLWRGWVVSVILLCHGGLSLANVLPSAVQQALRRAGVPPAALAVVVADAVPGGKTYLAHRAEAPMNPASVMKLVTTVAALDVLGPAYTWRTAVYTDGPVRDGVLAGSLYLRGEGDPKLVTERLWLLLRRVRDRCICAARATPSW